jgi:hypothetical protein
MVPPPLAPTAESGDIFIRLYLVLSLFFLTVAEDNIVPSL